GGLFARKSNYRGKKKNRGRSVREQLAAGHEDARRLSVKVVDEYVEDGTSASRHGADGERDQLERLLRDIAAKKLDIVIAWASSRLQRDLAVYVRLRDACWEHGVLWCYGGKVYDLSNPDDRFRTGLDALLGEREVDELRTNVMRTLRANAVTGVPHGITPYGYRRVYAPETGAFLRVEPDPFQAGIVREICLRVANGEDYRAIARSLDMRQIPAPALRWTKAMVKRLAVHKPENPEYEDLWQEVGDRLGKGEEHLDIARDLQARGIPLFMARWQPTTIKEYARDVRYLGARTHHGEVSAAEAWHAIVSKATHVRCKAVIEERDKKPHNSRPGKARYRLSGVMVCHICEHPVGTHRTDSGNMNYLCKQPGRNGEKGYHVSAQMEPVDAYVLSWLFSWLSSPAFVEAYTKGDAELVQKIEEAEAEAELLRQRLDGFYAAAAEGKLSPEGLAAVEAQTRPKIKDAEDRAKTLRAPAIVRDIIGATVEEVRAAWEKLTLPQQRMITDALVEVRLKPIGKGRDSAAVPAEDYVSVEPRKLFATAA
ncbi:MULTISPECIES: recombinase family protein, partial [unclassified Streptomyces]|uniref:recombinase family protein n=1 Tax=unclassified Streptomyces TaxID=2593676 RepID=UPI000373CD31